ncbi:HupC [Phenylobacterium sp. Root77]|uniref:cytochrome b/b6 domain-containing protein n=1 Tax=unclassified Phenylobacterium TaxID=2640670 RepID=UPI0006FECC67|nr:MULTISPECIES: cytochrome b/b6 domain-containing protein [unclassified Phenylobacterium]KQW70969.1 HupC [Phenylobacterium sp. Root1277]KQW95873.1 HupC [Phenylobacterium sp. Root1290]KRC41658.1 HupC [Phenylobacterium sp. Root77]
MPPPASTLVRRHSLVTRATHWINLAALVVLLLSGLQIFNAHPALYWGDVSTFARPWVAMFAGERGGEAVGVTKIGSTLFETTGVLGFSGNEVRGFPSWATLPSYRSLADGRRWHFAFAWLFVLNGLVYVSAGLIGGHFRRDLLPGRDQLAPGHLLREVSDHARLRFPKGEAARRYNALQKLTYLAVIFVLLPMMVLTGLSMSPGMNAGFPWLPELFGGRQSARTLHFISAGLIVLFVLVHVAMVLVSGPVNSLRAMITGKYAIGEDGR